MSIEIANQIDIVTISQNRGHIYLSISDHIDWQTKNKPLLLQQKINHYLAFIESGEMLLGYPQSASLNPIINLICQFEPNQEDQEFLVQIQAVIEEAGFSFEWKIFDPCNNTISESQQGL